MQFRLAYVSPESRVVGAGDLVDHQKKIALHYLKGYFLIDLFVAFPIPQVNFFLPPFSSLWKLFFSRDKFAHCNLVFQLSLTFNFQKCIMRYTNLTIKYFSHLFRYLLLPQLNIPLSCIFAIIGKHKNLWCCHFTDIQFGFFGILFLRSVICTTIYCRHLDTQR